MPPGPPGPEVARRRHVWRPSAESTAHDSRHGVAARATGVPHHPGSADLGSFDSGWPGHACMASGAGRTAHQEVIGWGGRATLSLLP